MSQLNRSMKVERSLEDLAEILGSRPPDWLLTFANIAVHAGEAAGERRAEAMTREPRRARHVTIDLTDCPPTDENDRIDFACRWETSGFRWVFPAFEGRLVAERDDSGSLVSIEGSYAEPSSTGDPGGEAAVSFAADVAATTLLNVVRVAVEEQARSGA